MPARDWRRNRSSFAYGRQRYVRIVRTCRRQRQRVGVPVEKRRPRVVGVDVAVERIGNRELAGGNRDPGDILLSAELIGAVVDRLLFASQEVKASPPSPLIGFPRPVAITAIWGRPHLRLSLIANNSQ
jgi:hypothetical protein